MSELGELFKEYKEIKEQEKQKRFEYYEPILVKLGAKELTKGVYRLGGFDCYPYKGRARNMKTGEMVSIKKAVEKRIRNINYGKYQKEKFEDMKNDILILLEQVKWFKIYIESELDPNSDNLNPIKFLNDAEKVLNEIKPKYCKMTENYWYYIPTSDCNAISQDEFDTLPEDDKKKYERVGG